MFDAYLINRQISNESLEEPVREVVILYDRNSPANVNSYKYVHLRVAYSTDKV